MRILVLVADRVNPPTSGARVRNHFLWKNLKQLGVEVRILGLDREPGLRFSPGPVSVESEFLSFERDDPLDRAINSLLYSYHQWPFSKALAKRVDEVAAEWNPQVIHAEEFRMASYLPAMRGKKSPAKQTATLHNVESNLLRSTGSSSYPLVKPLIEKIHLLNLLRFEAKLARDADLLFAYSQIDLQAYRKLYRNGNWSFTSGGADVRHRRPAPEVKDARLLLLGSWNYQPNLEGLQWFMSRVRPQISEKARITVAGSHASKSLQEKIREAGMSFVDTPSDLEVLYGSHSMAAVPLLSGSGTRGRILEAASFGRAVVTTPKGLEGLEFEKGEGVLVADSSDEFARKTNLLLDNPREREVIATRGYNKALAVYDWKSVAEDLLKQWKTITGRSHAHRAR